MLCRFEAISVYLKTMALSIENKKKYAPLAFQRANPPPKKQKKTPGKKPMTWVSLVDKLGADTALFKRHVSMKLLWWFELIAHINKIVVLALHADSAHEVEQAAQRGFRSWRWHLVQGGLPEEHQSVQECGQEGRAPEEEDADPPGHSEREKRTDLPRFENNIKLLSIIANIGPFRIFLDLVMCLCDDQYFILRFLPHVG
jgi:hypothetical protein